jgi:hypothetical protein
LMNLPVWHNKLPCFTLDYLYGKPLLGCLGQANVPTTKKFTEALRIQCFGDFLLGEEQWSSSDQWQSSVKILTRNYGLMVTSKTISSWYRKIDFILRTLVPFIDSLSLHSQWRSRAKTLPPPWMFQCGGSRLPLRNMHNHHPSDYKHFLTPATPQLTP